jgi:two-component system sensor histidine kinase and response regulator WspE
MQKMFLDEVTERSARLVEGAQALRAGTVSPQEAGDLLREGHTIKGTGRVMGYDDVGSAGLMLEMIWRWIQQGDITPVPLFGRVLEGLSAAIPRALDDPAELSVAMTAVHEFFDGQELPEELPPAPQVDGAAASSSEGASTDPDGGGGPVIFGERAAVPNDSAATVEAAEPAASDEPSEAETVGVDAAEGELEPVSNTEAVSSDDADSEPVVSAHDMFAQLASSEAELVGDGFVEAQRADREAIEADVDTEPADEETPVDGQVSEPVLSAHEMFAQLASLENETGEAEAGVVSDDSTEAPEAVESAASQEAPAVEPDEAEPLQAEVDSESAVEAVSVDEAESEPAMSAHDMFAQLASQEEASAEVETAEDHMDDGEAAEAEQEPPTMELVEDGHATDATVESESADETAADAARSAQEAFAELRRSMMQDAAAAHIAAEPEDHPDDTEAAPDVVDGDRDTTDVEEPIAAAVGDESADGEPVDVSTVDAAASAPEAPFGDVIEFPVSESDAESGEKAAGDADPSAIDDDQSQEATDVVVLPSNRKTQPQDSSDPKDLGGLVGAVKTWADEEPISVNTGRLYGLVNNIVTLRMNIESAKEQLAELAEVAAADPFFSDRVSHIAGEIEPIADASERIEGEALALAAAPLRDVTNTLPQLGRYLSRKTGKELRVEIVGDDVLVDRQVLDRLGDAIRQLVVNSAVHGIEDVDTRLGAAKPGTGSIRIEAKQTDVNLEVAVIDDGRGIDWKGIREKGLALGLLDSAGELAPDALRSLLYQSGFTTRDDADELAGDGDGLAVVRDAMESLNGSLRLESTPKVETRVSMVVPVHQAMQKALLVVAGGIMWGIPETGVLDVVEMNLATIAVADHTTVLERPDGDVPFASFADLMGQHSDAVPTSIVIATSAAGPVALGVEEIVGVRRIAAKELGAVLADAKADVVTGAALLGGDEVVLLVDTTRLAEKQREVAIETPAFPSARVLIVDDSVGVQQVVSSALATSGFNTSVAASVADALGALHSGSIDAVVVDFSMPRADGVALAHMVRQRHGDLPIVMLSGVAEGEDVDRARDAGVDAFFNKSDFREGGLAEKLRELITARREKEQTA